MKTKALIFTVMAALMLIGGLLINPEAALADTYYIGVPNTAISTYAGPYAQLDVTLVDSTHADIAITSLTNGNLLYLLGDGSSIALNIAGTPSIVGGIGGITGSNSYPGFTPGPLTGITSGKVDGLGSYNLVVDGFDGYTHSFTSLSFEVASSGVNWTDASQVLVDNLKGYFAANHIFVADVNNLGDGALATGYAANGGSPVPIPAAIWIFASGLVGLIGIRKRIG